MVETTVWFGIAASVFLAGVGLFVWFGATKGRLNSPLYYVPPLLAGIAGVAYAAMTAATLGLLPAVVDVELLRFADWLVTTPLITYYLATVAGVERTTRIAAIAVNVAMIALGYLFIAATGPLQWVAFSASTALYLLLVYLLVRTFQQALVGSSQSARSLFVSLRDLTVVTWSVYPAIYLFGPVGVGVITATDLNFIVAVLDVTAKVGLMAILLLRQYELSTFVSYDVAGTAG